MSLFDEKFKRIELEPDCWPHSHMVYGDEIALWYEEAKGEYPTEEQLEAYIEELGLEVWG